MNELQHLTTPTGLKFCLALCFSSGPNSSKFGPSCPQVGSQLFSFGERDGDNFFRARANPAMQLNPALICTLSCQETLIFVLKSYNRHC